MLRQIGYASHSHAVVVKMVFTILVVALILAAVLPSISPAPVDPRINLSQLLSELDYEVAVEEFKVSLENTPSDQKKLLLIRDIAKIWPEGTPSALEIEAYLSQNSPDKQELFLLTWKLWSGYRAEALERIHVLAAQEQPLPCSNLMLGILEFESDKLDRAVKFFAREVRVSGSSLAAHYEIIIRFKWGDIDALRNMIESPVYLRALSHWDKVEIARALQDWWLVIRFLPAAEFLGIGWGTITLVVIAGFVWCSFAIQTLRPWRDGIGCWALCLFAFLDGVISTQLTVVVGMMSEDIWGVTQTGDPVKDFIFWLIGVGFKEELIKLIFFLPLVTFVMHRGRMMEMLMIPALVGLGFAVQENIAYIENYSSSTAVSRFLTANFLHMAMTGLIGLALCKVLRGYDNWDHFFWTFAWVSFVHGLYDAFLSIPELEPYSIVSIICLAILSYYFFMELGAVREPGRDFISLNATFSIGLTIIVSTAFIYAAYSLSYQQAMAAVGYSALGLGPVIYLFLKEIEEL